jgi:hypothetical protein
MTLLDDLIFGFDEALEWPIDEDDDRNEREPDSTGQLERRSRTRSA